MEITLKKIININAGMIKASIRVFSLTIIFSFALSSYINAQTLERHQLITAYIYNLANNIQWQNEEAINEFQFLIIGEEKDILNEMHTLSNTKTLRGHPIKILSTLPADSIVGVHLIYISKDQEHSLTEIFDKIEGENILLISDGFQDKRLVMINFIEGEDETLSFEINKANIINQNLRFSDDIVLLGGTEIDVATLYREGQQSLRALQKHTDNLELNLLQLEHTITRKTEEIQVQKDSLDKQMLEMQAQNDSLIKQKFRIQQQHKTLSNQSQLLEEKQLNIKTQDQKIQEQQNTLNEQKVESEELYEDIKKGNELLQDQQDKILSQTKILEEKTGTIDKQQNYLYLLAVIIILVVILVFLIYYGYRNKQKLNTILESKVEERTNDLHITNEKLLVELSNRKLAEKKLIRNKILLESSIESPKDMIILSLDHKYRYLYFNKTHGELMLPAYGTMPRIGECILDIMTNENDIKKIKANYDRALAGESHIEIAEYGVGKARFYYEIRFNPIYNENHEIIGLTSFAQDITERKQIEQKMAEALEMASNAEKSADLGSWNWIIDGNKVVWSDNMCRLHGIEPSEYNATFEQASSFQYPEDIPYVNQQIELMLKQKKSRLFEYRIVTSAGEIKWVEGTNQLLFDKNGNIIEIVGTVQNITERKHIQEMILAKNKEMENYLYVASHDMRTPLVNIQGFGQRLKKQAGLIKDLLSDKQLEPELLYQLANITDNDIPKTLSFILSNIEKMDNLINGLLKLSRTGRIEMNIKKIDMNDLLTKIIKRLDFQITEVGCKIHINTLPECYGDAALLDQLFSNIISNALKYYDSERTLEITVEAKQNYNRLIYTIRDNGIGIEQKQLDKIWDVFYRIDPNSDETGEGIGLSLVKRIVEKHKGKVWVESEINKGSDFHVELQKLNFTQL